jgi:hypothetical protein
MLMIPILIVCYLRPEKLRELLESLVNSEHEVFVFIDRAETTQKDLNSEVNEIAMQYKNSMNLKVEWSSEKLGVAQGVPAAINWAFSYVEELIILEDDCFPTKYAFEFFENQRERIKNSIVMSCATSPWKNQSSEHQLNGVALSNYPLIWGWSTNKSNWKKISRLINSPTPHGRVLFSLIHNPSKALSVCFFYAAVIRVNRGKLAAWDCHVALEMLLSNYVSIISDVTLIENSGNDEMGSHPGDSISEDSQVISASSERAANTRFDSSSSFLSINNREIEKEIYRMKIRHYLSPIKALINL